MIHPNDARERRAARRRSTICAAFLLGFAPLLASAPVLGQVAAVEAAATTVGPRSGAVLAAGGGDLGPQIWERFVALAGGPDSRIIVIPTASTDEELAQGTEVPEWLRAAGAPHVTILHTRDPRVANSTAFVRPLLEATGIWISGGRQHRLVEAYLHTRVHAELFAVLERGGVVGGTSAGASVLASFLVRGDPETNERVMADEYVEGFGLLDSAAVDQHLLTRGREEDLWTILGLYPELLGIGLDEGTAIVIEGDVAEVVGTSRVLIYDASGGAPRREALDPGERFDLGARSRVTVGALAEPGAGVPALR